MIKKYIQVSKATFFLSMFFALVQSVLRAGLAIIFERTTEYAEKIKYLQLSQEALLLTLIIVLLYIFILCISDWLRRLFRCKFFIRVDKQVKLDYIKLVLKQPDMLFMKKEASYYMSRMTNDIPALINESIFEVFNLVLEGMKAVFSIMAAIYINPGLSAIFIILSGSIILVTGLFEKKFATVKVNLSEANEGYVTSLQYFFRGYTEIKSNGAGINFLNKISNSVDAQSKYKKKWWTLDAFYSPISALLTYLMTYSAIAITIYYYVFYGASMGVIVAAVFLSTNVYNPISNVVERLMYINSNKKLIDEVYKDFINTREISGVHVRKVSAIKFDNISIRYGDRQIIKNINLELEPGKKYLLRGESGAGKTTLFMALMEYIPYAGNIFINGIERCDVDDEDWNAHVAYIPQDPIIFYDTIRDNIDLAGKYGDDEIMDACMKTNLFASMDVSRLDERISDNESRLSGGEKQKISLCRALLKKPDLLLLDEATSALDAENTRDIENCIFDLKSTTVIYICHKATKETCTRFDGIFEISDGVIYALK